MTLYLYVFEDESKQQSSRPPTADDVAAIQAGLLEVIRFVSGVQFADGQFETLLDDGETWEPLKDLPGH